MTTLPRLALILMLAAGLVAVACSDDDKNDGGDAGNGPPDVTGEPTVTDSGLQIIDIEVGDGDEATEASTVTFHYTGWLAQDGTQFQTSVGGDPVTYALSDLIPGWQEGIPGMKEGGKRRLIIPPELGYGEAGRGDIPPNATLIFDIELVDTQ